MPYLSTLMGKPVTDADGERIGNLRDVIATLRGEMLHPEVVALVVKKRRDTTLIPFRDVAVLVAPAIPLTTSCKAITPYQPSEHDLYLTEDVLDKQIIDTNGVRVVRVNDLELVRVNGHFYVANVDIGGLGLLRRLGLLGPVRWLARLFRRELRPSIISWDNVELLASDQPMRLRVSGDKIGELHPADLAEILGDLSRAESNRLLESLDVKTLADALEEVEPDFQASLIEAMPDERVADVLEEMAPDEAADLLAELPEDRTRELLKLMERDEAEDVRKLLTYPEDRAGGIMTTDFIAIRPSLNAGQVVAVLRKMADEFETPHYIYVTDDENRLIGVFSLAELVLAQANTPVTAFMNRRVASVKLTDSQDDVAQVVAKYNLMAAPVVDHEGRLHGMVTADDALDKIIPTSWKKRLPRLYH